MYLLRAAYITSIKIADSLGNCLQMSSLAMKMDSRYIHFFCTLTMRSTVSETPLSAFSHLSIFSAKEL